MKPWHIMQFKLEELLEKISIIDNTNEEVKEFGDYLIANILICKEIAEQKEEIKRCAQSFEYFCTKYVKIAHATRGIIPLICFKYQRRVIKSYENKIFR